MTSRALLLVVLLVTGVSAQNGTGFDRAAAQRDTLALLKELVALETQNPPGNERVPIASLGWCTEYLYRVLSTVAMR